MVTCAAWDPDRHGRSRRAPGGAGGGLALAGRGGVEETPVEQFSQE